MYLGVVAPPNDEHEFDGQIFLKRVSKKEGYKRVTYHQNFCDSGWVNDDLKNGSWRELVTTNDGMQLNNLRDSIANAYNLIDADIADRLVLKYPSFNLGGKQTINYIHKDDDWLGDKTIRTVSGGDSRPLDLQDCRLVVKCKRGQEREVDVSCNSKYMLQVMPIVGDAIRNKFHWVPDEIPIFLYIDNAGGHGTDEAVNKYCTDLAEQKNVVCIHQCPRSPESNMLDLGVWMAFQSKVEHRHVLFRRETNALARTVEAAWIELDQQKLQNVFVRWKKVLEIIIADDGDNMQVAQRKGKLFSVPSDDVENIDDDDCEDVNDEVEQGFNFSDGHDPDE